LTVKKTIDKKNAANAQIPEKKKSEQNRADFRHNEEWCIYILLCRDGTLYTGITKDLPRRLKQHGKGNASKYTRSRLPVKLLYTERFPDKSHALRREIQIKSLSRKEKLNFIASVYRNCSTLE
jgi:putative endonuclease